MKKAQGILTGVFLGILTAAYGIWIFSAGTALSMASAIASAGLSVLFGLCGVYTIRLVLAAWAGEPEYNAAAGLGRRSLRPRVRHPVVMLCLILVISRVMVYVLAYALSVLHKGYGGGLIDTLSLWIKGDAPHYLGIAENWYAAAGDPRYHLVFFPLFPVLVRLFGQAMGNYFASGLLVSNLAAVAAGYLLYELCLLDMDRAGARRAVKFQFLMPAAFLFCAPMSDSLFLLVSVACLYLMRKGHFLSAGLVGAAASFTRLQGLLLLAPLGVELVARLLRERQQGGGGRAFVWANIRRFACLLVLPIGSLLYLYINYDIAGNPFQFMIYQKEHWSQSLGWFFNTAAYQTDRFLTSRVGEPAMAYGLWLPNLIYLFGSLFAILPALKTPKGNLGAEALEVEAEPEARPLRASYAVYFLVYFFFSVGATWLLSAPRYLTAAVPLSLALGQITRRRWLNHVLTIAFALGQIGYLYAYVAGWPVY